MATSSGADRIKLEDYLRKVAIGPNFTPLQPFNNSNNSNSNNNINNNNNKLIMMIIIVEIHTAKVLHS